MPDETVLVPDSSRLMGGRQALRQAEFWPYANGKVTSTEMKTLTKIIVASTAGILSAGLATAGAFAATGA